MPKLQNRIFAKYQCILIFIVLVVACLLFSKPIQAANLVYSENFDDRSISQPSVGSMTTYKNIIDSAVEGTDYSYSPGGPTGSGYFFSGAQDVDAYLRWWYEYKLWPTDEAYVSFYQKFENFTPTAPHENLKFFYPHFRSSSTTSPGNSSIHSGVYGTRSDSYIAGVCEIPPCYPSLWIGVVYYNQEATNFGDSTRDASTLLDSNWHHIEYWWKFSTGDVKIWYDGNLICNGDNPTPGYFSREVYYLTFGEMDASPLGTFKRGYDNIEVWDGMPSSDATPPGGPTGLRIL